MGTLVGVIAIGVQFDRFLVFIIRVCIVNCIRFISVIVNETGIEIISVEAIIGDVRLGMGKGVHCCIGDVAIVIVGAISGVSFSLVNRKSIVGGNVMIKNMFGLLSLCMGRKSE